jgi:cardiolipin synthase
VDDHLTFLGSANLDLRSFQLNFEASVILYGKTPTVALQERAKETMAQSHAVRLEELRHRPFAKEVAEGLCRLLSPLL